MVAKARVYNWYAAMVAAGCMVLYGYDAAVFNAVQTNPHWLDWFDQPVSTQRKRMCGWKLILSVGG
jgi:hypothetical protein